MRIMKFLFIIGITIFVIILEKNPHSYDILL